MEKFHFENQKIVNSDIENCTIIFTTKEEITQNPTWLSKHFMHSLAHLEQKLTFIEYYKDDYFGNLNLNYNENKSLSMFFASNGEKLFFVIEEGTNINRLINMINRELKKQPFTSTKNSYLLVLIMSLVIVSIKDLTKKFQNRVENLEDNIILDNERKKYNLLILKLRRDLENIRRRIEEVSDFLDILGYQVEDEQYKQYIKLISNRASRSYDNIKILIDHTSQLKEMYQNLLDIGLNNSMNIMTVVSIIFLPLTLITGWYGMNVDLPIFDTKNNYIVPYLITIISILVTVWLIRKYNFLNKNK
ncbi:CorA family divalent cation transporter [Mycoplasma sp. P36-A1]|uniref:CorA family divalent cation transporter n=1 Tax=Mycoplasma sp. P36-A1 TaxID=3252900 RepID=UPI003C2B64AD